MPCSVPKDVVFLKVPIFNKTSSIGVVTLWGRLATSAVTVASGLPALMSSKIFLTEGINFSINLESNNSWIFIISGIFGGTVSLLVITVW